MDDDLSAARGQIGLLRASRLRLARALLLVPEAYVWDDDREEARRVVEEAVQETRRRS